jgi:transposase
MKRNEELDSKNLKIYYENFRRYGVPKMYHVLQKQGEKVSLKHVQRRMAFLGIKSIVVKKYKPVKTEKIQEQKENILNHTTTSINQKWCTDITYIILKKNGWTYLASVKDLYSRKIIGWAFGLTMNAELAQYKIRHLYSKKGI